MVYVAAVIGCHGVGKTTLVRKLGKLGFKIFNEAPINDFMGKNSFMAELNVLLDNIRINGEISRDSELCVSDRFAFLDILIYCEGFVKLGWLNREQLKTIYFFINNSGHEWVLPNVLLCMNGSKDDLLNNIRNRNRDGVLKEGDESYLNTIMDLFDDFYNNKLDFEYLNPELKSKVYAIPKKVVNCNYYADCDELGRIVELIKH
ncbi:Deoxynucleoside kinase [Candidatus Tiddalikarchaeum anstoanum]|nr:Deoxynucleoside kinase [Candidatus Tiddalikarchaeum anstoanum]